jgi:hypothetical protein
MLVVMQQTSFVLYVQHLQSMYLRTVLLSGYFTGGQNITTFIDTCFKITLHQNIKLNTELHHRKNNFQLYSQYTKLQRKKSVPRTKEHSALAGSTTMVFPFPAPQPHPQGYHLLAHTGYDTYKIKAAGCSIRIGRKIFSFLGGRRKGRYLNRRQQILFL